MKTRMKYAGIAIVVALTLGLAQFAAARDLIVVASKNTQESSKDWLGFLESREVPVKLVTPENFSEVKGELFIVVLGIPDESKAMEEIVGEALTPDELKSIKTKGKMFYKPQAWNVGQKVILILGPNQDEVRNARIDSQEEWYDMLKEWFDIEDLEGFHVY